MSHLPLSPLRLNQNTALLRSVILTRHALQLRHSTELFSNASRRHHRRRPVCLIPASFHFHWRVREKFAGRRFGPKQRRYHQRYGECLANERSRDHEVQARTGRESLGAVPQSPSATVLGVPLWLGPDEEDHLCGAN